MRFPFRDLPRALATLLFLTVIMLRGEAAHLPPADLHLPIPPRPSCFFTIDLDPHYQVVGNGALTEEEAATADCYWFTYGPDGRPVKIEYRVAGMPSVDPFFQVDQIEFEYKPGVERRWYKDANGQLIQNIDGIEGEELTLNSAGYVTTVTNLNANGGHTRDSSDVISYNRMLDAQGRLVSARRTGLLGTNIRDNNGFFETTTIYDNQNRRIEYANRDANGDLLNNNLGVALTRTTYTLYPDSMQTIESYFNATGENAEEAGTGVHERQKMFDKRGFLVSEAYFDAIGAPCLSDENGVHERRFQYDARGNQISEEYFGFDGRPKNVKPSGYSRLNYKYDAKNLVIEKAYFGDDGSPQIVPEIGAAVIRQEYDEKGNLTRRQFFDGQGNPCLHARYGAAAIRIQVTGDTTTITLRDASDRPTRNPVNGFASFSYKTLTDSPLTRHNNYFDRHGYHMGRLRVFVINPHLYALRTTPIMKKSARYGVTATGLGALFAVYLSLRKWWHTSRRKVYVPSRTERFLSWLALLAIIEGIIRFLITIWWAYVGYQNGQMGSGVYILETLFLLLMLYRLLRLRVTLRVLNVEREDVLRLIHEFMAKAQIEPAWQKAQKTFSSEHLRIRFIYSELKSHAYLSFQSYQQLGRDLERGMKHYIRAEASALTGPKRTWGIAIYYPAVALIYFLLALTAFYTLWQMMK